MKILQESHEKQLTCKNGEYGRIAREVENARKEGEKKEKRMKELEEACSKEKANVAAVTKKLKNTEKELKTAQEAVKTVDKEHNDRAVANFQKYERLLEENKELKELIDST